jgi:hypothetical protein
MRKFIIAAALGLALVAATAGSALGSQPPGQLGNHGNNGNGPAGYEGQPGGQGGN